MLLVPKQIQLPPNPLWAHCGWRQPRDLRGRPSAYPDSQLVSRTASCAGLGICDAWVTFKIRCKGERTTPRFRATSKASQATYVDEEPSEPEAAAPEARFSPQASKSLSEAAWALRRFGWLGFWSQLALSLTSAVVLVFSVAFTAQSAPVISLYTTLFGVITSFVSTFKSSSYVRLARRLRAYLEAPKGADVQMIKKSQVLNSLSQGVFLNIMGLGSTAVGLQAAVGILLAKTLTNTTANPFLAGGTGSWNPVLAFDVFLLQASTNTILAHFIGLAIALWMVTRLREKGIIGLILGN